MQERELKRERERERTTQTLSAELKSDKLSVKWTQRNKDIRKEHTS
jgi:hypothetical protein